MQPVRAKRLVILDCDGVLVDSEQLLVEVRQQMLADVGVRLTHDELVQRFVGTPHRDFVAQVVLLGGRPLPPEWDDEYAHRCRTAFEEHLTVVPGIEAALDRIDLPTCVASSGSHDKMRMTLGITGLLPRFEGRLFSASDVRRGKPHPDLFLHAAKQMGFEPVECFVVEDSEAGVKAGLSAGMRVIAYGAGVTPRERLQLPGVIVIDDMSALPEVVRGEAC